MIVIINYVCMCGLLAYWCLCVWDRIVNRTQCSYYLHYMSPFETIYAYWHVFKKVKSSTHWLTTEWRAIVDTIPSRFAEYTFVSRRFGFDTFSEVLLFLGKCSVFRLSNLGREPQYADIVCSKVKVSRSQVVLPISSWWQDPVLTSLKQNESFLICRRI